MEERVGLLKAAVFVEVFVENDTPTSRYNTFHQSSGMEIGVQTSLLARVKSGSTCIWNTGARQASALPDSTLCSAGVAGLAYFVPSPVLPKVLRKES